MLTGGTTERGSVLVLVPALVLVLLILGAIAVDSAIEYLGHRQLQDFTAGVADQIAAASLDRGAFYGRGRVVLVESSAAAVATELAPTADTGSLSQVHATATVSPDGQTVTVTATAVVHDVFGPAVGGQRSVTITARSSAHVAEINENA